MSVADWVISGALVALAFVVGWIVVGWGRDP